MKHSKRIAIYIMILGLIILSGCLFPKDELAQNQVPYEDQLNSVQHAVDEFKEETEGLVPIITKSMDTPIFEKYIVDFDQLKQNNSLSSVPGNSFEKGGVFQYVLIDPEQSADVKLIDLRISEVLSSIQTKLSIYRDKNLYPPFGREVSDGLYMINYEELNLSSEPHVVSPFSEENLPIVMDVEGNLYVDYRIDLMQALEEFEHDYEPGDDIRYLLTDHYPFVPAYSVPYTLEDGEPVFMLDD